MVVLIALVMFFFLGAVAFCVDVAYMQLSRTQLRIATDAAARAAGEALSRSQTLEDARQAARDVAAANLVAGAPLLLDDEDIVPGAVTRSANGSWTFAADGVPVNGLRVSGRRTADSPSGSVRLFFGRIFQVFQFEPTHHAVVVRMDRDICLVVDRSSSMKLYLTDTEDVMSSSDPRFCQPPHGVHSGTGPYSRWSALVDAIDVFTDTLATTTPQEQVALVSYASGGTWCSLVNNETDLDRSLTGDLSQVTSAVSAISSRVFNGGTKIGAGIERGTQVLTNPATARPFARKTMIVMTDGYQTSGVSPVTAAEAAASLGITVHTITFGTDPDHPQMQEVAAAGGGQHFHAASAAELQQVFQEIALALPVLLTE